MLFRSTRSSKKPTRNTIGRNSLALIAGCFLVAGFVAIFVLFFEGGSPLVEITTRGNYLGQTGIFSYRVGDKVSGIRRFTLTAEQDGKVHPLHQEEFARAAWRNPAGPLELAGEISFDLNKAGFQDGELKLIAEASDFSWRGWFKGNTNRQVVSMLVDTVPPQLQLLHGQRYILPGGSGIAIYRLSDPESEHGVRLNGRFHPGHLVGDGRDDVYIAYFALPYDHRQVEELKAIATDPAGNSTSVAFTSVVKKANYKQDTIAIGDTFLEAKIPEFVGYYPEMTGDNLEKYLYVNQTLRIENNNRISQLCADSAPERLWRDSFQRMPGSSRAGFADHRTYSYNGKIIDQQTHLGVDIASTRQAAVRAANSGKVVHADYLGIYGNMVLVDHGQGVFSLYSHLSQMDVKPGEMVDQQTVLGLTGTSGMAGGDHLHFSMLINGEFVTPLEWWDQHWLEVNIDEPLIDSRL